MKGIKTIIQLLTARERRNGYYSYRYGSAS